MNGRRPSRAPTTFVFNVVGVSLGGLTRGPAEGVGGVLGSLGSVSGGRPLSLQHFGSRLVACAHTIHMSRPASSDVTYVSRAGALVSSILICLSLCCRD